MMKPMTRTLLPKAHAQYAGVEKGYMSYAVVPLAGDRWRVESVDDRKASPVVKPLTGALSLVVADNYARACAEGKRPSGKPPGAVMPPTTVLRVRLDAKRTEKYNALGGIKWLRATLDKTKVAK